MSPAHAQATVTGTVARTPDSRAAMKSTGLIRVSERMKLNANRAAIPQKADFIGV